MVGAILHSIGGLGLFLLGMSLLTDGLKTLAGPGLRRLLRRWTRTPTTGAISGALVTAIVQSSSATTITAVGMVGAGLLTFPHALGIVLGANVGTTATGWLVAVFGFKISLDTIAMPMVLAGALIRMFAKDWIAAVGHSIAGFAVIFIGIAVLQEGMAAFQGIVSPENLPGDDILGRLQLVGIGIAVTVVTQSSSAGVAVALTALNAGTIGFGQAAAMVIGMNVGTTVTAALATIGGSAAVKHTGFAHVVYNLLTGAMAFMLLGLYVRLGEELGLDNNPEMFLVGFHTLFNTLGVVLVLPFAGQFAALVERLITSREPVLSRHLERKLLKEPALALEAVRSTLLEISAWTIAILRPVLAGRPPAPAGEALAPLTNALMESHSYLEDLTKKKPSEQISRKNVHLMYAADHLDRVVVRLGTHDRIDTIVANNELQQAALELDSIAKRVDIWVREPTVEDLSVDAKQAWQRLEEYKESYRRDVLERAATGRLTVSDSMRRLDAMRWLVRVAHHLWRLLHHLHEAQLKRGRGLGDPAEHEADA